MRDPFDVTVHLVLDDFGKLGRAYRETDEGEADFKSLIEDMESGQFKAPVRVVAFNTTEGWSRDVSEDVAIELAQRAQPLPRDTQAFVDGQIAGPSIVPAALAGQGMTPHQALEFIASAAVPNHENPMEVVLQFQEIATRALGLNDNDVREPIARSALRR